MANQIHLTDVLKGKQNPVYASSVSLATNSFLAYTSKTPTVYNGDTYITTIEVLPSGLNQVSTYLQSMLSVTAITAAANA
jgi:hypothetical protein